jgi:hypothetical protein
LGWLSEKVLAVAGAEQEDESVQVDVQGALCVGRSAFLTGGLLG